MSRLSIRRPHLLKHAEAHRRVSRAAVKLAEHFGAACHWEGDLLRIEHPNVNGTVRVGRDEIVVDARLGFALSMFRGRVEQEITRIIDRELEA
jgi:putative polyhydroxyalkanoate system protein